MILITTWKHWKSSKIKSRRHIAQGVCNSHLRSFSMLISSPKGPSSLMKQNLLLSGGCGVCWGYIQFESCYLSSNPYTTTYLSDGLGEIILCLHISISLLVKWEQLQCSLSTGTWRYEGCDTCTPIRACFAYCEPNLLSIVTVWVQCLKTPITARRKWKWSKEAWGLLSLSFFIHD